MARDLVVVAGNSRLIDQFPGNKRQDAVPRGNEAMSKLARRGLELSWSKHLMHEVISSLL